MVSMFFCWYILKEKNAKLTLDLCMYIEREVLNSVKFCFMLVFIIREMEIYTETALMCPSVNHFCSKVPYSHKEVN